MRTSLSSLANVQFRRLDALQLSIPALNALLKSPAFWEQLGAEAQHALFFQTDSLLLHGDVAPFLEYDYVGAPWHRQNERWGPRQAEMPAGVGNGGLSLRSVPAMLELSRQYGTGTGSGNASASAAARAGLQEQEDFFFSQLMERAPQQYRLAPRQQAYRFCVEVPCADIEAGWHPQPGVMPQTLPHVPMALHASW